MFLGAIRDIINGESSHGKTIDLFSTFWSHFVSADTVKSVLPDFMPHSQTIAVRHPRAFRSV